MKLEGVVLIATLAVLTCVYSSSARKECRDRHRSCRQIGKKKPLNRCYRKHTSHECCATCRRLKIDIPDCEYGDKQKWCTSIGRRYSVAGCYESKDDCCQTCHNLDTGIPDCPFGDKVQWCLHIGTIYGEDTCLTGGNVTCCETCYKINQQNTPPTTAPTEPPTANQNSSNLPPNVHGHVINSEGAVTSRDDASNTQPIPTRTSSSSASMTSRPTSQTLTNSKSSNVSNTGASPLNPQRPTTNNSDSSSSLKVPSSNQQQSSTHTYDHVTERVSHVNKMAEFYVSISPAPRTTPNSPNSDIKHIENTPSPSPSNSGDKDTDPDSIDMDEILLPIDENLDESESNSENIKPTDNTGSVDQYPKEPSGSRDPSTSHDPSASRDPSRSNEGQGHYNDLETDDEDLLAPEGAEGSGYHSNGVPKRQQHDRFAFEHDMWGGENNIYDEAEKEYVYDEFPVHASAASAQLSLTLTSTALFMALLGSL